MKRHAFDPLSFFFGVIFLAIAAALSIPGIDIDPSLLRWIGAGALILVGAAMLLGSMRPPDRWRGSAP